MGRFCGYCGLGLEAGSERCPNCGAVPLPRPALVPGQDAREAPGEYGVLLCSLGACSWLKGRELLKKVAGYSEEEAEKLLSLIPTQVAFHLSRGQAKILARAMAQEGLSVALRAGEAYVELEEEGASPKKDRAYRQKAAEFFITAGEDLRVEEPVRWIRPVPREIIYRPGARRSSYEK
ncbi:MAG: hypothetical protein IIZ39_05200 [Blautia sp.]|nr:hypothetical protein [Blautia sp.]